jgi:Reverse transcriptase (RNA-dependent DNA polymerase)
LVVQDYTQQIVIDFEETFASISHLDSIRIFLTYTSHKGFILFQMDVKSVFLNRFLDEEVYVQQSLRFVNQTYHNHVYRFTKQNIPNHFYFQIVLLKVKMTILSSLRRMIMISYWYKFILMI